MGKTASWPNLAVAGGDGGPMWSYSPTARCITHDAGSGSRGGEGSHSTPPLAPAGILLTVDLAPELASTLLDALVRLVVEPTRAYVELAGGGPAAGTRDVKPAGAGLLKRALMLVVHRFPALVVGIRSLPSSRMTCRCARSSGPNRGCETRSGLGTTGMPTLKCSHDVLGCRSLRTGDR
jgi:hypothetical protein